MLQIHNISKRFGDKVLFTNRSLEINKGITVLMGPSGSGKTTFVNILCGLMAPDTGHVTLPPETVIAMTFQEDRLIEHATVLDNVLLPITSKSKTQALELLDKLDLSGESQKKVYTLSGGMKRRVALCRSLLMPFTFLILDEPFKGLDDLTKSHVLELLQTYNDGEKYILIISHDKAAVAELHAPVLTL